MVRRMQPCDWQEHDVYSSHGSAEYVIDAYGRTPEKEVIRVRITGFKPYFYVRLPADLDMEWSAGVKTSTESKYDIFAGFNGFHPIEVLKVECSSMNVYRSTLSSLREINKESQRDGLPGIDLYETNIPPFLRFFHERGIQPASPFVFQPLREDPKAEKEDVKCQTCYLANYQDIASDASASTIPLKVCSYDLEVYSESGAFPVASKPSDEIIQIGMTFRWSHDLMKIVSRKILVLGTIPDDPEMESCPDEMTLLARFKDVILQENPDILCGYNTFGFDDKYIVDRAITLHKMKDFQIGRLRMNAPRGKTHHEMLLEHKKFELASGTYDVNFLRMPGRLPIDLLLNMRREHNLDSYKLDNVANTFLRDKVVEYRNGTVTTKSTRGLRVGNFIRFDIVGNTTEPYQDGTKYVVTSVNSKGFTIDAEGTLFEDLAPKDRKSLEWTFTKDDIHPQDIFRKQKGTPEDRADIARYCLQDCDLVVTLMAKLDTIVNARGMADVCIVPMQYLFLRGQGIKIYSRVVYEASKRNQIVATQEALEGDISYEGAIVIPPKIGMYLDQPISVLDYNSLYPSSMILENLSPDTFVCRKYYTSEGRLVPHMHEGATAAQLDAWREEGYVFNEVRYTEGEFVCACIYVSPPKDHPLGIGIIPTALHIMLSKRKESRLQAEYKTATTKTGESYVGLFSETETSVTLKKGKESKTIPKNTIAKIEDTYDDAQKSVFNGLQLAYKVVANSMYGQLGSRTSPIRKMCVAACTTAVGRRQLLYAKDLVEREYGAEVVYGDTDSIFIKFKTQDLAESIALGQRAADQITASGSKNPDVMKIGYEKTFYPFILFCRKRYVGMMYEDDPKSKPKRKSMGIVLKRRDNAPIVKDVFGGALDLLLDRKTVPEAATFVHDMLTRVLRHELPIEKFVITKQLRDDYKDPSKIAHRVLADRMKARDPGSAPNVGDRLQFVYVEQPTNQTGRKVLQGDRIEALEYVKAHGLHPDAEFYVTNQIQNPVAQLFALCIDRIPGYKEPRPSYKELFIQGMEKHENDEEASTLWVLERKEKQLESLLFLSSPAMVKLIRAGRTGPLDAFFRAPKKA
jgi:DNA polymerase elongation subunit (family B)